MVRVEAAWEDETGTPQVATAMLEEKSAGGANVRLKKRIGIGLAVKIAGTKEQFSGIVRHCFHDGAEYVLGIQRDPENPK